MAEAEQPGGTTRERISDRPFEPSSAADLRRTLDAAGMLYGQSESGGKGKLLYPKHLIQRLYDEFVAGQRSFYHTQYRGEDHPVVESGMSTYRGQIYYPAPVSGRLHLIQCAADFPQGQIDVPPMFDPDHLPAGFIRKKDSSTSGKLPIGGTADPKKALFTGLRWQLGLPADYFRMRGEPVYKQVEDFSFLFPKLLTRFDNTTFSLDMLPVGFRNEYIAKGMPFKRDGNLLVPVTVSTWVPG